MKHSYASVVICPVWDPVPTPTICSARWLRLVSGSLYWCVHPPEVEPLVVCHIQPSGSTTHCKEHDVSSSFVVATVPETSIDSVAVVTPSRPPPNGDTVLASIGKSADGNDTVTVPVPVPGGVIVLLLEPLTNNVPATTLAAVVLTQVNAAAFTWSDLLGGTGSMTDADPATPAVKTNPRRPETVLTAPPTPSFPADAGVTTIACVPPRAQFSSMTESCPIG